MDTDRSLRNRQVARVVVGVPEGHQHLRARIETDAGDVITLQEATLAALARAYLSIKTHPARQAVELRSTRVEGGKPGFAEHQLLETSTHEQALRYELAAAPRQGGAATPPAPAPDGFPPGGMGPTTRPSVQPGGGEFVAQPEDPTAPFRRPSLDVAHTNTAPATAPLDLDTNLGLGGDDDVEADDLSEVDDGPVFGAVPTIHSKPRSKKRSGRGGQ